MNKQIEARGSLRTVTETYSPISSDDMSAAEASYKNVMSKVAAMEYFNVNITEDRFGALVISYEYIARSD